MNNIEKAKKHLASLGATSDSVAAKLKACRVKGKRESFDYCPIAIWLSKKMPTCKVGVTEEVFLIDEGSCCDEEGKLPASVRKFIKDFDDGKYPHLEYSRGK